MKIGAQFFTIRDFCQTIKDFDESCKKIKEIGYNYVQLSAIGNFSADEIRPILDKYDLKTVCTHRSAENYLNNLEREVEFHKKLDCKIAGIGAMPEFNVKPETIETFVTNFKPVVKRFAEEGIIFAYHNHAFEFEKINGKFAFEILCDSMAADNFRAILDVYWLSYAGVNPAKFIREHSKNIGCIHFKDLRVVDNKPCYAEIGNGNIDWDDVISACNECGVEYALVEQDGNHMDNDPFKSLKISYDFLKQKGIV